MSDIELQSLSARSSTSEMFEALAQYQKKSTLDRDPESQSESPPVKRRFVFIAGGVVFCLWLAALFGYSSSRTLSVHHGTPISLQDYRRATFHPFESDIQFLGSKSQYIHSFQSTYTLKDASDEHFEKVLFNETDLQCGETSHHVDLVKVSPTLEWALVQTDAKSQWRHSTLSRYWLYHFESETFVPLYSEDLLNHAEWSPQGNYVSFVYENNLYVKPVNGSAVQVTADGSEKVLNGKPDWVYEEEVLASESAMWWSDDERFLTFLKTNDTQVPTYYIDCYVSEVGGTPYPVSKELRYPKPGFPNPQTEVWVYGIADQKLVPVEAKSGTDIVYDIAWVGPHFIVKNANRDSSRLDILAVDPKTGSSVMARTIDAAEYGGWIEKCSPILNTPVGYIDTIVVDEKDQLALFQNATSSKPVLVSSLTQQVLMGGAIGFQAPDVVFFSATSENSMVREFSSLNLSDMSVTTYLSDGYYDVSLSGDLSTALVSYRGPDLPKQALIPVTEPSSAKLAFEEAPSLVINDVKQAESKFAMPTKHHHPNFKLNDGTLVDVIEVRPAQFNSAKRYPMLVNVYGGPGSVYLDAKRSVGFEDVAVSQLECVALYIEPRGTGAKGWGFKKWAKGKIGHWEPRDIVEVTQHWISESRYIDDEKVAIWGWSYGGYTTLKTLEFDAGETFKYGMAVAPVTDWRFYDSVYTERYMGLLADNESGYKEAKVSNMANLGKVKRLLLMHGTADDNVHVQNTYALVDMLDLAGVENYDLHVFPDSDHSIYWHNANAIVYDKLMEWLRRSFM